MITVSDESIDKVFEFLDNLDEEAAIQLGNRFIREQPYLQTFVQAMTALDDDDDDESESEEVDSAIEIDLGEDQSMGEELNYLAIFIWKAFELEGAAITTIPEKQIEAVSASSMDDLYGLVKNSEDDNENEEVAKKHFKNMRQPALFSFLLSEIFGDPEDPGFNEDFTDEDANYLFLISNQVLQILDEHVNGARLKVVH